MSVNHLYCAWKINKSSPTLSEERELKSLLQSTSSPLYCEITLHVCTGNRSIIN